MLSFEQDSANLQRQQGRPLPGAAGQQTKVLASEGFVWQFLSEESSFAYISGSKGFGSDL